MGESWNIQGLLRDMAGRGDRPALVALRPGRVERWSCAEVADLATRLAAGLTEAGLRPGEPVALIGPNSPEWVVVRLALAAAGALAVPIDDQASDAELATLLSDCGARRVFAAAAHRRALDTVAGRAGLDLAVLDLAVLDLAVRDQAVLDAAAPAAGARSWRALLAARAGVLAPVDPAAPAMLVYTSGTTGVPKSFTLSEANIAANVRALAAERIIGPADRVLLPLPLHHVYPFVVGVLSALTGGAAVVFPEGIAGPQIAEALRRGEATVLIGVPRLYGALLAALEARVAARGRLARGAFRVLLAGAIQARERLGLHPGRVLFAALRRRLAPRLWLMVSGGARLEPAIVRRLEGLGWTVLSGYGLAETASIFTANRPGRRRLGSEGQALAGGEVRIAAPDARGVGEIQLRGPSVFAGYRGGAAANRDAFAADGWFRTGDLGFLDPDGYVHVTGRAKEVIVLGGGKKVYPEELEAAYGASRLIEEIAVLERDGKLVGLVRPDLDAIRARGTSRIEDAVRVALAEVAQRLAGFQRLSGFAVAREALPRTRLGKYRRFLLPGLYEQARGRAAPAAPGPPSAEDAALLARPPARAVWDWLGARFAGQALALDASPQLDLGVDSLDWLNLTIELQDRFGVRLGEDRVAEMRTLRDLIRAVVEAGPGAAAGAPAPALDPAQARWLEPAGPGLRALGWALWLLVWLAARALFRLRVEGAGRLPARGPFVLVPNHASDIDGFVLAAALPRRLVGEVYWGGEVTRLFATRPARAFSRAAQIFPVDERRPAATIALAAEVLVRGRALAWFPEAWRSPTGALQHFLPGIGVLVRETGAPAVPVFIAGTFEAMPRGRRLPRPGRVTVRFGAPVDAGALAGAADDIAEALHARVAALAERDERGDGP